MTMPGWVRKWLNGHAKEDKVEPYEAVEQNQKAQAELAEALDKITEHLRGDKHADSRS